MKGMLYLEAWAAKGGGKFWIKGMFLIKGMLYLEAWAARGGEVDMPNDERMHDGSSSYVSSEEVDGYDLICDDVV